MKSMNSKAGDKGDGCSPFFYGSATVGERGQMVIPAEARADMGFHPGDKLMILRHPLHMGLMVFKIESARAFLDEFTASLEQIEAHGMEDKVN